MKVLIDINHPAHVHFFKQPARQLQAAGHQLLFTSRDKECTLSLLEELGFPHRRLSSIGDGSVLGFAKELLTRNARLLKVVRQFQPDVMAAIGGTFIAHVGFLTRTPRVAFYDTEMATLQNRITYPLLSKLCVPNCYTGPVPVHTQRYQGYHELCYLSPAHFTAQRQLAIDNGLQPDRRNFLLRVVSWQANHDLNEQGWSQILLEQVFDQLASLGHVIISSERPLPERLERWRYRGKASDMHHLMACCDLFVGESSTMASECAVLGVPAVYAASTSRGYLEELQQRYGLVTVLTRFDYDAIARAIAQALETDAKDYQCAREQLLNEAVDVSATVVKMIEQTAA